MGGYLEAYGAGEERRVRRTRLIKISLIVLVCAGIIGAVLYAVFKNHAEEWKVKSFLDALRKPDYQAAYQMWGCNEAHPCRDYSFDKFMEDWGPKSAHAGVAGARIGLSQSCGNGVLLRVDYQGAEPVQLWVERSTKVVSYAPWPECPGRHLRIGAWLRSLFN
ncbi:MAG: hypothetical protein M3O35_19395 [Acidobacteriota bacterium]|nr:hypothetical protein [Acidobacteriota bacterium]